MTDNPVNYTNYAKSRIRHSRDLGKQNNNVLDGDYFVVGQ